MQRIVISGFATISYIHEIMFTQRGDLLHYLLFHGDVKKVSVFSIPPAKIQLFFIYTNKQKEKPPVGTIFNSHARMARLRERILLAYAQGLSGDERSEPSQQDGSEGDPAPRLFGCKERRPRVADPSHHDGYGGPNGYRGES